MAHIVADKEDFEKQLTDAGSKLVVVDFHAPWCGPCKQIGPFVEELAGEFSADVVFLKVDCDDVEEVATMYDVTTIPKFIFIKNKEKVEEMIGANQDKLKSLVSNLK